MPAYDDIDDARLLEGPDAFGASRAAFAELTATLAAPKPPAAASTQRPGKPLCATRRFAASPAQRGGIGGMSLGLMA